MNQPPRFLAAICALALVPAAAAGPRSSANYAVLTDTLDAGGRASVAGTYANVGSLGGLTGISVATTPAETAKAGFIGQLTEVVGLSLSTPFTFVNELATIPVSAAYYLDDASSTALAAGAVAWSVTNGPLTINATGLASAAAVYRDTTATVQGVTGGFTGMLNLLVQDSLLDNYGSYAGDGIDDSWQFQYFGLDNPNAAPGVDFSGTGQTNLFKFVAGLNPLDPTARFVVTARDVPGQPTQRLVSFSPVLPGHIYVVQFNSNLATPGASNWTTLPGSSFMDTGNVRTVLDPNAVGARRFYRVLIDRP